MPRQYRRGTVYRSGWASRRIALAMIFPFALFIALLVALAVLG